MDIKSIIEQNKQSNQKLLSNPGRVFFNPSKLSKENFKELVKIKMTERIIIQNEETEIKNMKYDNLVINDTKHNLDTEKLLDEFYIYLTTGKGLLKPNKGILISGSIGVGKTLLLYGLTRFITTASRKNVTHLHANELPDWIKEEKFESLYRRPMYLEDIGRELKEYNHYGTVYNPFYDLMIIRYKYGSWTFGCSNLKLSSMEEMYGKFIVSRMNSMFNIIYMVGDSNRG